MAPFFRKHSVAISLLFLTGLSGFIRFYRLHTIPSGLYIDEAVNGNDAVHALTTGSWRVFYPANNGREGLFINLQAISIYFFGATPWALRAVSALMGVLTVLGLYLLVRYLYDERRALVAAVLQSVIIWPVIVARFGIRVNMATAVIVWLLWAAAHAYRFRESDENTGRSGQAWALLTGTLLGLGFHTYISFRIVPAIILFMAYMASRENRQRSLKTTLTVLSTAAVVVLPLLVYFLSHTEAISGRTSQVSVLSEPRPVLHFVYNIVLEAGMFFFGGDRNWRHNYGGAPMLSWIPATLFVIGFWQVSVTLRRAIKGRSLQDASNADLLLLSWFVIGSFPGIVSIRSEFPHGLRLYLICPAVCAIAALGWHRLHAQIDRLQQTKLRSSITARVESRTQASRAPRQNTATFLMTLLLGTTAISNFYRFAFDYADRPEVRAAFLYPQTLQAQRLLSTHSLRKRYLTVPFGEMPKDSLPLLANTIAFLTHSQTSALRDAHNIHFALASDPPHGDSVEVEPIPLETFGK